MKWHELEQFQSQDLDAKIVVAERAIRAAFDVAQNPAVAFSGGKDSTVLLHLIRATHPERAAAMPVIFGNTGVEYPESARFARRLAADWNLNFQEAKPGKTELPGFKYEGQRRIWQRLQSDGAFQQVVKPDGKLKSTASLEAACPPDLRAQLEAERLLWPAGTTMSYWWCADQYGWPLLGKAWSMLDARRINIDTFLRFSQSNSNKSKLLAYYRILRQVKISQHCCQVLKKEPSQRVQAELGVDLVFKGLMASESRSRAKNFLTRGWLFEGASKSYLSDRPFFHCQPLATWTDADIWAYIRRFHVPYSSLYDMTFIDEAGHPQHIRRNGCLGCGTDFGFKNNHLQILRQTHPAAWRAVMRQGMAQQIRNLQRALKDGQCNIFDAWPTDELIDAQPCVFDDTDGLGGSERPDGLIYDPESE